jgi:diacylglycerol kinase (ATP)
VIEWRQDRASSAGRHRSFLRTNPVQYTTLILANPTAKRGERAVRRVVQKLTASYEQVGCQVIARFTERQGPRERGIVTAHAHEVQTVVVVGGDGTVRETVLAMTAEQRTAIRIGFVPMGNANVLAREVGIALDDEDLAIAQVLQGETRRMDAGAVNGQAKFLLMLDAGYFARVVHAVAKTRRSRWTNWLYAFGGDLLYGGIGLLKLLPFGAAKLAVTIDQQPPFVTSSIAIANASVYAKSGSQCPDAVMTDGLLNFNALRNRQTLRFSMAAMRGKPNPAISTLGTAVSFLLRAQSRPFFCQVDGDPLGDGPLQELTVDVLPDFYSLIVPVSQT